MDLLAARGVPPNIQTMGVDTQSVEKSQPGKSCDFGDFSTDRVSTPIAGISNGTPRAMGESIRSCTVLDGPGITYHDTLIPVVITGTLRIDQEDSGRLHGEFIIFNKKYHLFLYYLT